MNQDADLLERVVAELETRKGDLPKVAKDSGIAYDTVLRIKNRENDPGYSKVRALANYLFQRSAEPPTPDPRPLEAAAAEVSNG